MSENRLTYPVDIAGVHRELQLFEIKPGLRIAILNILGDTELVTACARALAEKLKDLAYDVVVTAETKSIPLAHALSVETGKPYVILRKTYKPYMGDALSAETLSITTGQPQTLYLDEKDRQLDGWQARDHPGRCDQHWIYPAGHAPVDGTRPCPGRGRNRDLYRGRARQMAQYHLARAFAGLYGLRKIK